MRVSRMGRPSRRATSDPMAVHSTVPRITARRAVASTPRSSMPRVPFLPRGPRVDPMSGELERLDRPLSPLDRVRQVAREVRPGR